MNLCGINVFKNYTEFYGVHTEINGENRKTQKYTDILILEI